MSRELAKMNLISVVQQLPKKDIEIIQGYVEIIEEQNQELKKQLEENKDKINWYENFEINKTIDKLRIKHNNQQKEFIEYLEKEKERCLTFYSSTPCMYAYDVFKEILSKYK